MKPRSLRDRATLRREIVMRGHAIRQYAAAHDAIGDLEQELRGEGRIVEAEGAHQYALIALRAYTAEIDDPEPRP